MVIRENILLLNLTLQSFKSSKKSKWMDGWRKKSLFLPSSLSGGKVLNDWISPYGNAGLFNRTFSDPCGAGALIASSSLLWTGTYSPHYLWCNDSIQMGKSDQVESELWVLIRSSCSMETESLCLKTSKHKFHILKSILNLWRYKCRNNKFWNLDHVCFVINRSCTFTAINENRLFFLLFASESRHFFSFHLSIFREKFLPMRLYSLSCIVLTFD